MEFKEILAFRVGYKTDGVVVMNVRKRSNKDRAAARLTETSPGAGVDSIPAGSEGFSETERSSYTAARITQRTQGQRERLLSRMTTAYLPVNAISLKISFEYQADAGRDGRYSGRPMISTTTSGGRKSSPATMSYMSRCGPRG